MIEDDYEDGEDLEDEDDPPIEITAANYSVSGASARRCAYLTMRYDADYGYRPGDGETWIVANDVEEDPETRQVIRGRTFIACGTDAWYTRLWSTLAGSIYVARHDGWIIRNPDVFGPDAVSSWKYDQIEDRTLLGVFGIDDSTVFVWGHDPRARAGGPYPASDIFRWDGQRWNPMPGPGFHITAMHGTAADDLWVGGPRGVPA